MIKMTAEQYRMLGEDPPGVRLDLVDGRIIVRATPDPDHSRVTLALASVLQGFVREHRLGHLLLNLDVIYDAYTVRRADVLFVSKRHTKIIKEVVHGPPDLCIEVTSPSTATDDRVEKFRLYCESGVKNYWIFDPHARMAEAFVLKNGEYVPAGSGRDKEVVKFPPFPKLALRLGDIWPKA
jgi:Uma2 family endonuclease